MLHIRLTYTYGSSDLRNFEMTGHTFPYSSEEEGSYKQAHVVAYGAFYVDRVLCPVVISPYLRTFEDPHRIQTTRIRCTRISQVLCRPGTLVLTGSGRLKPLWRREPLGLGPKETNPGSRRA